MVKTDFGSPGTIPEGPVNRKRSRILTVDFHPPGRKIPWLSRQDFTRDGGTRPLAQDPHDPRRLGLYMALAQVGMEMVVPVVLGVILDLNLGWTPWGIVAGALLGLVGGLAHMLVLVKRLSDRDK